MSLEEWLFVNKVSQIEMAESLGIHKQTLNCIIKKRTSPLLSTALKIFRFTGKEVQLEELLKDSQLLDIAEIDPFISSARKTISLTIV